MRILLTIFSLAGAGGAERVMTVMANYMAENGRDVTVFTYDDGSKPPFYRLHPNVNIVSLNYKNRHYNAVKRLINTRRCLLQEKPDIIISFTTATNVKILRAMLFSNIPVVVSERNIHSNFTRHPVSKYLRNLLYLKARCVVFQTQTMKEYFPPRIRRKSVIIPNPVPKAAGTVAPAEISIPKGRILLAVGSLVQERVYLKGFDMLIPIFSELSKRHPGWSLVILGEGSGRASLEQEIKNLKLQNRVFLPGSVKDIYTVLKQGDLFVMTSRYEGFPNVLCEAMASGLPAVSFDCPSGPGNIIRNGIDGVLVAPQDQKGMIKALDELMSNESMRKAMGQKAKKVVERFSVERIMGMWEQVINSAVYMTNQRD